MMSHRLHFTVQNQNNNILHPQEKQFNQFYQRHVYTLPNHSAPDGPIIRGNPDPRDVLDVFIFCETHYLSEADGDALIILIIQLFRRHPTIKT